MITAGSVYIRHCISENCVRMPLMPTRFSPRVVSFLRVRPLWLFRYKHGNQKLLSSGRGACKTMSGSLRVVAHFTWLYSITWHKIRHQRLAETERWNCSVIGRQWDTRQIVFRLLFVRPVVYSSICKQRLRHSLTASWSQMLPSKKRYWDQMTCSTSFLTEQWEHVMILRSIEFRYRTFSTLTSGTCVIFYKAFRVSKLI